MAKLNFKQTSRSRTLKGVPDKYKESRGKQNISQSDGIRPAFPLMPWKSLPKGFEDLNTGDNVVIPKGRIVSALTQNSLLLGEEGEAGSAVTEREIYGVGRGVMGLMVPANGGNARPITSAAGGRDGGEAAYTIAANVPIGIVEHDVYQDIRGVNLNYDMRNKNWGILTQQLIKVLSIDTYAFDLFLGEAGGFVAASGTEVGAENQSGTYSAVLDLSGATGSNVTVGGEWATYSAAVTGAIFNTVASISYDGDALALTADYTVDGSGNITFVSTQDFTGTDEEVTINFTYDIGNLGSGAPASADAVADSGYDVVEKKYSFLTINSEAGDGETGQFIVSDRYGNYASKNSGARTNQVVGRLMGIDYRFQKDLLDTVQSKYEADAAFRTAGTGTMGVPQFVYNFAYEALVAGLATTTQTWSAKFGTQAEASVIADACAAGAFGEAWIQLNI